MATSESTKKISRLDAILFALSLEVSLQQIRITEGCLQLRLSQAKFSEKRDKLKVDKLTKDRELVTDILKRVLIELVECGEWSTLGEAVSSLEKRESLIIAKRLQYDELRNTLESTIKEINSKHDQWNQQLNNTDQKVALLRDKIKDDLLNAKARICFAEKYLYAKAESMELQLQKKTKRKPLPSTNHEERIHQEILKLFDLQTKEREEAIEFWRNKYNDDLCDINERLANKREQLKVKIARREELQKLIFGIKNAKSKHVLNDIIGLVLKFSKMLAICEDTKKISRLDAILFALSLEVSLQQIRITEGCLQLRLSQAKFSEKRDKLKVDKLTKDRELVTDILKRVLIELVECGEWSTLGEAVSSLEKRESLIIAKRLQYDELRNTLESTIKEINSKHDQWNQQLNNTDQKVALLRDKIKDDLLNAKARICFAEKYLYAKAESMELQLQKKTKRKPLPSTNHEERIHQEILKLFDLQTKEREEAIEFWRNKYNDDLCDINERLANKREQLKVKIARREELQKLYDVHSGEIHAWLTFKQQRAERLAREEHQRASATRIQAWWRGVMVRRALGPFKYLKNVKKSPAKSKKK